MQNINRKSSIIKNNLNLETAMLTALTIMSATILIFLYLYIQSLQNKIDSLVNQIENLTNTAAVLQEQISTINETLDSASFITKSPVEVLEKETKSNERVRYGYFDFYADDGWFFGAAIGWLLAKFLFDRFH